MIFKIDGTAFALSVIFFGAIFLLNRWRQAILPPRLLFSNVKDLIVINKSWREHFFSLPKTLYFCALICLFIAFIDPHLFVSKKEQMPNGMSESKPLESLKSIEVPTEGIAIYLVVDRSGSMAEEVKATFLDGTGTVISKEELLKQVTSEFVQGDSSDLIGLVGFARSAQVIAPLTLDHRAVLEEIRKLDVVQSRDQDSTAIGYALYKTTALIAATRHYAQEKIKEGKPAYDIKNSIIILVTDGFQSPSPLDKGSRLRNMDLSEAAEYAKLQNVRVYIVNLESKMTSNQFALQRRLMERTAAETGGRFYLIGSNNNNLHEIYAEIEGIEKSSFSQFLGLKESESSSLKPEQNPLYRRISFYPFFIVLGMIFLFIAIILETTVLRTFP